MSSDGSGAGSALSRRALVLAVLGLAYGRPSPAFSSIAIVANTPIAEEGLSLDDLRAVFLGTKTSVRNCHLHPVLSAGSAHQQFIREVLGKSDSSLRIYYRSLVFTGRGQVPKEVQSEAEALAYVRETPGGITYVSAASAASLSDTHLRTVRVR